MSKCGGESDIGVCTTSVLATRKPLQGGNFRLKTCLDAQNVAWILEATKRELYEHNMLYANHVCVFGSAIH